MLHVILLPFYRNSAAHSFAILQLFYRNSITHSTAILLPFYCICTAYSTTNSTAILVSTSAAGFTMISRMEVWLQAETHSLILYTSSGITSIEVAIWLQAVILVN